LPTRRASDLVHRREILARAALQDNDVPRRRCVFDILGVIESRQDLQSQDLGVKAPAALDVIALERAVGESLRQVAAFRQALVGERLIPMAGGGSAAVLGARGVGSFELQGG